MDTFIYDTLHKWGVELIPRPDYFTGKNRTITVVIDERIEYGTVIFEDALSVFMSTTTLEDVIGTLSKHVYHKLIVDFFHAVNKYTRMWQMMVKPHGKYFWEIVVDQIQVSLNRMHIQINDFGMLEYWKCLRKFGGRSGFRQFMYNSINQDLNGDIPRCLYCDNCRINKNGVRRCAKVAVVMPENKHHSRLMRILTLEKNASNYIEDILVYLSGKECDQFCPRSTKLVNRCIRVKNKQ